MGYFDDYLKALDNEIKAILGQEELYKFRTLFDQPCVLESLPRLFLIFVDLTKYLLNRIQSLEKGNKKDFLSYLKSFITKIV